LNKTRDTSGLCKSASYTGWESPVTNWCIPYFAAANTAFYCGSNTIYTKHNVNNVVFCINWLNNVAITNTANAGYDVSDRAFCKTPCTNINYLSYNSSHAHAYGYNIVANNSTNTFRDQFLNGALSCYSGSATTNNAVFMQNVACVPQNTAIRVYCGSTIGTSQILIPIYHPTSGKRCLDLAQNKVVSAPADFCLSSSSSGVTTPTLNSFTGGLFNFGSESGETSPTPAVNTTITYKPEDLSKYEMYILGQGFADLTLDKDNNKFLKNSSVTKSNKYAVSLAERVAKIGDATIKTNGATFTTPDGIYWDITDNFNTTNPHALVNVYVDGQSSSSTACSYSDSCKNPNKFIFKVEKMGKVTPVLASDTSKVDPIGCSYLRYPNIKKRKQIPTDAIVNPCFK